MLKKKIEVKWATQKKIKKKWKNGAKSGVHFSSEAAKATGAPQRQHSQVHWLEQTVAPLPRTRSEASAHFPSTHE